MNEIDDLTLDLIISKACGNDDIVTANTLSSMSKRFKETVDRLHPITSVTLDMEKLDSICVIHWTRNHGDEIRELRYREAHKSDGIGNLEGDGIQWTPDGHHNIWDSDILSTFTGLRSLVFVNNNGWLREMYPFLESSKRTLEHLDVYMDEEGFDDRTLEITEELPELKRLLIGSWGETHYELDHSFFLMYPDLEVFRCYGDARIYTSPEFFENLADHKNLREIRLNTLRDMSMEEVLYAGAAIHPIRLPKQIEYADVECAKIDGESFDGCTKLRVLMLPPITMGNANDDEDNNYDDFDTSLWQHWRSSMEVLVSDMVCMYYIVPSEIVRATGPPKLAIYLEMIRGAHMIDSIQCLANLSEIVRSVTICTGKYTFARHVRTVGGHGSYATEAAMSDAIRAVCPHATVDIVKCFSVGDYYVENVEDASTLLGSPAAKWWTSDTRDRKPDTPCR